MEQDINQDPQNEAEKLAAALDPKRIELLPFYHDLRSKIIKPKSVVVESKYFFRNWKPLLGPVLTLLIMELRDRCYYNPQTGEKRNFCWPSLEELAKSIGTNERTIRRTLKHPFASQFIKIEPRYRYDPKLNKKLRTSNVYHIAMDDPLIPKDEGKMAVFAAEQILEEARKEKKSPKDQNDLQVKPALKSQNHLPDKMSVRSRVEKTPLESQKSSTGQIVRQYSSDKLSDEEVLLRDTLNNVNVNEVKKASLKNPKKKPLRDDEFAKQLAREMQDTKSLGWYRKVVERLDAEGERGIIQRARGEVLEIAQSGNIKKSKGALFTQLVKLYASERGIDLK